MRSFGTFLSWAMLPLMAMAVAQAAPADLPPAPAGQVLDVGGLFERDPDGLQKISERLADLRREHAMPVYLVIYGGILDGDAEERAHALFDSWIGPQEEGLVVVWDTDTGRVEPALPATAFLGSPEEEGTARLEDRRIREALEEAMAETAELGDTREKIERFSSVLMARLDWALREEKGGGLGANGGVVMVTLGILLVLGTAGLLVGRILRRSEVEAQRQCYFPEVTVGTRLEAPYAGGKIAVVDYSGKGSGGEGANN